jgi:hypothetical protein
VDFQKHMFFIIVGVVVVGAIGFYAVTVPTISQEAEAAKTECVNKAANIKKLATAALLPDGLKTPKHVAVAKEYQDKLARTTEALKTAWSERAKLKVATDAKTGIEFETWLAARRKAIMEKAAKEGVELPGTKDGLAMDKIMFSDSPTDDKSATISLHREYRLKHMAIIEEVVDAMTKKYGKQKVQKWQEGGELKEEEVDVGVLKVERLAISPATRKPNEKNDALVEAAKRAGRNTAGTSPKHVDLPYTLTSVDIVFVAPLAAVSHIVKDLESRDRYLGVVSRLDLQRASQPFPAANEEAVRNSKAGPLAQVNTFFQEAPVRVLVTLDIYEYDKNKEVVEAEKPVAKK